jgi:hypothetical protein
MKISNLLTAVFSLRIHKLGTALAAGAIWIGILLGAIQHKEVVPDVKFKFLSHRSTLIHIG